MYLVIAYLVTAIHVYPCTHTAFFGPNCVAAYDDIGEIGRFREKHAVLRGDERLVFHALASCLLQTGAVTYFRPA